MFFDSRNYSFSLNIYLAILVIRYLPAKIYQLKVDNENTRKKCEIGSRFTIKTPERHQWRFSSTSRVDVERINVCWVVCYACELCLKFLEWRKEKNWSDRPIVFTVFFQTWSSYNEKIKLWKIWTTLFLIAETQRINGLPWLGFKWIYHGPFSDHVS